jgi:microcystin-dependent protein
MYCDGSLLNVSTNQALFSLLGTNFGGDGKTTFGVPDLRNASPNPNMHYCIALAGIYPSRS